MSSGKEIIDRIRREEYLVGIVSQDATITRGAERLKQKLGHALKLLADELYETETHFVLELVQNAEDNKYAPSVKPYIEFEVHPERIVVRNNELGFSAPDVQSLCSVGESAKSKDSGFVGEKGIGFKSVFKVTDRPEIHSNGFHFCFDRTKSDDLLGYVIPHWLENCTNEPGTQIVLPARNGRPFSASLLDEIHPALLLFLRKLREIRIRKHAEGISESMTVQTHGDISELRHDTKDAKGKTTTRQRSSLLTRLSVDMSSVQEEKREGLSKTELVLAFPLDKKSMADSQTEPRLFAFLPVRAYGFRFVIQGDFILVSNRGDILQDRPWNIKLRDSIAHAFTASLPLFKKEQGLRVSFLQYVPRPSEITDPFFTPVRDAIYQQLRDTDCMLTQSGEWRKPGRVLVGDSEVRELVPDDVVNDVFDKAYLADTVSAPAEVLEKLGCERFQITHLIKCLEKKEWVASQDIAWFAKLFRYLALQTPPDDVIKQMRSLAVIRLASKATVSLADGAVFLPSAEAIAYGFAQELRFLDASVVNTYPEHQSAILDFLSKLGLRPATPFDIIDHHILPMHRTDKWQSVEAASRLEHIAYIKEHYSEYVRRDPQKRRDLIQTLWIKTTTPSGNLFYYARPFKLYMGKDYGNDARLEELFQGQKDIVFVSGDYLKLKLANSEIDADENLRSWWKFFEDISVAALPRVHKAEGQGRGPHTEITQRATTTQYEDWDLAPETKVLLGGSDEQVIRLLTIIDQKWGSFYSRFKEGLVRGTYYNRAWTEKATSSFLATVSAVKVPTARGDKVPLCDTYLGSEEIKAAFGSGAPYLAIELKNAEFLQAVGVTCSVDWPAAMKRLLELNATTDVEFNSICKLYRIAEMAFDGDPNGVKSVFASNKIIFIPGKPGTWVESGAACWTSYGGVVGRAYPPLDKHYREFESFFIAKLEVRRELESEQLVKVLRELDGKEGLSSDEKGRAARRIYEELETRLRSQVGTPARTETERLIGAFKQETLVWTNKQEFWKDDGDLFVNDLPDIGALFAEDTSCAFLGVEPGALPKLDQFIQALGLERLSSAIKRVFPDSVKQEPEPALTELIRERWLDIARYLYSRENPLYELLVSTGKLRSLETIDVVVVPDLSVTIQLRDSTVSTRCRSANVDGRILLDTEASDDIDCLAAEVCRILSLADHSLVSLLLNAGGPKEIERIFKNRNILELPPDERSRLFGEVVEQPQEAAEEEPAQVGPQETSAAEAAAPQETKHEESLSNGSALGASAEVQEGAAVEGEPAEGKPEGLPRGGGAGHRGGGSRGVRRLKIRRGRAVSYADPGDDSDESHPKDNAEKNSDLGRRAAVIAKEYEENARPPRKATIMPETNPGYDLVSEAPDGSVRYIEVKGVEGPWTEYGVAVSARQFRFAEAKGDQFWLYVVEFLGDPSRTKVWPIHNPADRVTHFHFDHGWRSYSEDFAPGAEVLPEEGDSIEIGGQQAKIISVSRSGKLMKLMLRFPDGSEEAEIFKPGVTVLKKKNVQGA